MFDKKNHNIMFQRSKGNEIIVSVLCLTYNQVLYVRDCLNGFVMQKTDFAFEVIVHDDASTDGTKEIIQEYADRYPNIIKPIFETDNQYSKVGFGGIKKIVKPYLKGKYIAFCEGDDYWIDSCKLQKQMHIFRENEQIDFVFTNIDYLYEESGKRINRFLTTNGRRVSKNFSDHLFNTNFIAPCTWMYKSKFFLVDDKKYVDASFVTALEIFANGKVFFLDDVTAVYRCIKESASHSASFEKRYRHLKGVMDIKKEYIGKYRQLVNQHDIDNFYVDWYGQAYRMFVAGDKKEFAEACSFFLHTHRYDKYFFYSLPKPILSYLIKLRYNKYLKN